MTGEPAGGAAAIIGGSSSAIITVHSLDQAIAALRASSRAGRQIVLASAPDAGGYIGPGWFKALVTAARERVPDACFMAALDCGDSPGAALAAIRAEVEGIIFTGRPDVARRLAAIAQQHGVRFETERAVAALDLDLFALPDEVERRCVEFLRRAPQTCS